MSNGLEEAKQAITEVCEALKTSPAIGRAIDDLCAFLHGKQDKYDNSVFEPCRIFTSASIETLIRVRLDDKVTRILRGDRGDEDPFDDFAGYLVLLRALPIFLELMEARTVPGPVVTTARLNRGLRVGMTFEEVRDNKWTECEGTLDEHDNAPSCTEGDPCSACKFLDGALCACGHPYTVHTLAMASTASDCMTCNHDNCLDFSLASWPSESLDDVAAEVAAHVNANVDGWTATPSASKRLADAINTNLDGASAAPTEDGSEHGAVTITAAEPKKEPTMADTKKPRVNRATWHETDEGKDAILRVTGALTSEPVKSWYARELANEISVGASDVSLALDYLLTTGAIVKHGKAKGTRYAIAGFTDWPAPLPRGKKQDDQFAEEEPPIIIGTHGAT